MNNALLRVTLGGLVAAASLTAVASATQPLDQTVRISTQAPDGNADFGVRSPAVALNTTTGQSLFVWVGETATNDEFEIFGRIVGPDGRPVGNAVRLSDMGPDDDVTYAAEAPAVAYNSVANEYMVTWYGDDDTAPLVNGEREVFAQRVSASGVEISGDTRVSNMGPDGTGLYNAFESAITHNPTANEYLVIWRGYDNSGALVANETEIFGQRLSQDGTELGGDFRISDMGQDGDTDFGVFGPAVVYNPTSNEYLAAWAGDDNSGALVNNELEIYAQRISPTGAELGVDTRLSEMGVDGDPGSDASGVAIAHNPKANEYMVTWRGNDNVAPLASSEREAYAQRVSAAGAEIGADTRVSDMGPDGDASFEVSGTSVAYNPTADEFFVIWQGEDNTPPLVNDETEIFGQRLTPAGAEVGVDTRISDLGPDGDANYDARSGRVVHNAVTNEYLVAWSGDDNTAPLVDQETEIWARRVQGGFPPGSTNALCATPPTIGGSGGGGTLKLTVGQLKINQAIGAAAVRRANAIQAWLEDGVEGRDLCGSSLVAADFDSGVATTAGPFGPDATIANPRPVSIPKAKDKNATFTLTAKQLRTNQRVYAAAVRRANALRKRIAGELTGGDIKDGKLGRDRLRRDITIGTTTPAVSPPAKSKTEIKKPGTSSATIKPTLKQLQINQKIATAAVKRTNALRTLLATGLKGQNFKDGSITAQDLESTPAP